MSPKGLGCFQVKPMRRDYQKMKEKQEKKKEISQNQYFRFQEEKMISASKRGSCEKFKGEFGKEKMGF